MRTAVLIAAAALAVAGCDKIQNHLAAKADKFAQQCMPKQPAQVQVPPTAAQGARLPSKRTK